MNNAHVLTTFDITPQSNVVRATSGYSFNIVHVVPLALNDYVIFNFDASMDISNPVSCNAVSGLTGVSCTRVSNSQLRITYTAIPSSQTLQYQITNIINYEIADTLIIYDATVYSS
jgi:hypothetical protein